MGELTAAEWDALERGRRHAEKHRTVVDTLDTPAPTLEVVGHDPAVTAAEDGHGCIATCTCGWESTSSWRLNPGFPLTERYAWLEVDDHLRGHDG